MTGDEKTGGFILRTLNMNMKNNWLAFAEPRLRLLTEIFLGKGNALCMVRYEGHHIL